MLLPSEEHNYYENREIVPPDMLPEVRRAEIVITNYHAFQHRETLSLPKVARSFLQGNAPEALKTTETDADMLHGACGKLLNYDRVNVLNDEAHHCYRHKVGRDVERPLTGEDPWVVSDFSLMDAIESGIVSCRACRSPVIWCRPRRWFIATYGSISAKACRRPPQAPAG